MESNLTKREIQIIQEVAGGFSSKEIASRLFISERTVETHRKNIKNKLGKINFYAVISWACKVGLLHSINS